MTPKELYVRAKDGQVIGDGRKQIEVLLGMISEIDQALRVDAAEYVPAIRDVFDIIDFRSGQFAEVDDTQ